MTSRWIVELFNLIKFDNDEDKNKFTVAVERVDALLERAAYAVDNENLSDEIMEEISE